MPKNDEELAKGQSKPDPAKKKDKPESKPKEAAAKAKPSSSDVPVKPVVAKPSPAAAVSPTASAAVESEAGKPASRNPLAAVAGANWKSLAIRTASVVVALVAVVLVVFGVLIYGYKSENSAVKAVARVVPYPVERVNGRFVSYSDYLFEVDANKRAYQNNAKLNNQPAVDFNSADGKKLVVQIKQHALDKLKGDAVTAQLADQRHVKVTDKEVNDLINQLYQRYGGKDTLLKTLNQIYGWNINDLKSVVRKQLLTRDLETNITTDKKVDAAAKAKAQDVLKKVKDGGDFAALAKQYSQASDASKGGDMGSVTKDNVPAVMWTAVTALQAGQVSDVVKEPYGYEILKAVDKPDDNTVHVQEILIKTTDFNSYFQTQLKDAKVNVYIKA